jgi:hypothetical protein
MAARIFLGLIRIILLLLLFLIVLSADDHWMTTIEMNLGPGMSMVRKC